jgi:hypothetical protein
VIGSGDFLSPQRRDSRRPGIDGHERLRLGRKAGDPARGQLTAQRVPVQTGLCGEGRDPLAEAELSDAVFARRPSSTMRIFSSAECCLRVRRPMSFTTVSAGGLYGPDFCLNFTLFRLR